jgi:hypothetical protein
VLLHQVSLLSGYITFFVARSSVCWDYHLETSAFISTLARLVDRENIKAFIRRESF